MIKLSRRRCGTALVVGLVAVAISGATSLALAARAQTKVRVRIDVSGRGAVTISPSRAMCPPSCTIDVEAGRALRLTASARAGSFFLGWSGACEGRTGNSCELTPTVATDVGAAFVTEGTTTAATPPTHTMPPTIGGTANSPPTLPPPTSRPPQKPKPKPPAASAEAWNQIKQAKLQLPTGAVVYVFPRKLDAGETAKVQLVVSPKDSVDRLKKRVTATGRKVGTTAKLSPIMRADLTSNDFEVNLIGGDPERAVPENDSTVWAWWVTPTRTGVLRLVLTLSAIIRLENTDRQLEIIPTKELTITISVGWSARAKRFVSHNWQWMWGAILAPLAVLIYPRLKDRASPAKQPPRKPARRAGTSKRGRRR